MACRMWENNFSVLQIGITEGDQGVGKGSHKWLWKWVKSVRPKTKGTVCEQRTLIDNVILHKTMN